MARKMAKRSPEQQITKGGHDLVDESNEYTGNNIASPRIMAMRKILNPKGKSFQFSNTMNVETSPELISQTLPIIKTEKLKALANQFKKSIEKATIDHSVPDYRQLARKYIKYYEEIEDSTEASKISKSPTEARYVESQNQTKPLASGNINPFTHVWNGERRFSNIVESTDVSKSEIGAEVDSDDASRKTISLKRPLFSLTTIPIIENNTFSFGASKSTKNSDPDSKFEQKGPSFSFDKEVRDPAFKFQSDLRSDGQVSKTLSVAADELKQSAEDLISSAPPAELPSAFGHIGNESPATSGTLFQVHALPVKNDDVQITSLEMNGEDSIIPHECSDPSIPNAAPATIEMEEDTLFQVRAKLMLLNTENLSNPYQTLGIGDLKVLSPENGGSLRVLLRAEGGLRVLLNTLLIRDVHYSQFGNGSFVRFPALNEKLEFVTYVFKVGSPESGEKLCRILNTAKEV